MGVEPFRDNWSYLKVEMTWLERILLNAVAKARATEAKVNRHTKTPADRASRDWWEGLMNFEKVGYDSPPPLNPKPTQSYQQQLEARIQESQAAGVSLVLPMLCDRYELSLFERQTVLLAIAPEVHRRYGELCGYLSGQGKQGLPTVDLALRLFCRDDQAWRLGRSQLLTGALVTEGILIPFLLPSQSFLQQPLKLNPHWVSELLGAQSIRGSVERAVGQSVAHTAGHAAGRAVGREGLEPFPAPSAECSSFPDPSFPDLTLTDLKPTDLKPTDLKPLNVKALPIVSLRSLVASDVSNVSSASNISSTSNISSASSAPDSRDVSDDRLDVSSLHVSSPPQSTQPPKNISAQIPDFISSQCQQTITRLSAIPWTGQAVLCIGLDRLLACQSENSSALSWHDFYGSIAKTLNLEPHHLDLTFLNLSDFNLLEWSNLSHDRALSQGLSHPEPELTDSDQPASQLLIIQSAHLLLRRKASLTRLEKVKFIEQMRSRYRLILLDSAYPIALEQVWRSWIQTTIALPCKPVRSTRSRANDA